MRCGSAQKLIIAAVDGEITPDRRRDLDEHVAGCTGCQGELRATERLFGALGTVPQEAQVPALVESATIRRMRIAAAEERERAERRWGWIPTPVLAAAGVSVLALVITLRPGGEGTAPPAAAIRMRRRVAASTSGGTSASWGRLSSAPRSDSVACSSPRHSVHAATCSSRSRRRSGVISPSTAATISFCADPHRIV